MACLSSIDRAASEASSTWYLALPPPQPRTNSGIISLRMRASYLCHRLFQALEPRKKDLQLSLACIVEVIEVGAAIDDFPVIFGCDGQKLVSNRLQPLRLFALHVVVDLAGVLGRPRHQ